MSEPPTPSPASRRRAPLTRRERWIVVAAAVGPVVVGVVVLAPAAVIGTATPVEVLVAGVVYGGLLGLAGGFVAVDRLQARQCPRCHRRNERGAAVCDGCGYDLAERPRFACTERHRAYLEPGLCECGRRLQRLEVARGVGREVRAVLRIGVWLLAFLVIAGLLLQLLAG